MSLPHVLVVAGVTPVTVVRTSRRRGAGAPTFQSSSWQRRFSSRKLGILILEQRRGPPASGPTGPDVSNAIRTKPVSRNIQGWHARLISAFELSICPAAVVYHNGDVRCLTGQGALPVIHYPLTAASRSTQAAILGAPKMN